MEATLQTSLDWRARARFIGLLAGFSAGVLNAIVARALMRVIALLMFGRGSFSVGGTAVIFMFGALAGPLFVLIYRSTLYKMRAPEFRAELMAVGPLGFAIFAVMNFSFVLTLAGLVAWLEKAWSRDATRPRIEQVASTALGFLALSGLLLLLVEIGGRALGLIE
ncbi:MAG TPA: hypothetical protein VJ785_07705 [Anaerolineales bacterium]|nr:hypothetical protein [Anaerolineales bacterium]